MDAPLAYARHFPAIHWLLSYSLYLDNIDDYLRQHLGDEWIEMRTDSMRLLQEESELQEIVRLVGVDSLSNRERLVLETARSIREDFLLQNAFHDIDTYCSLEKQKLMMRLIMTFHEEALKALEKEADLDKLFALPVRERIARAKYTPEQELGEFDDIMAEIVAQIAGVTAVGGEDVA